jgi:hypothetical protein
MKFQFGSGFDGGQRQWFIMEIFDQQTNVLQANISSKYPVFTVNGLDSGKMLKIIIYAINMKGRSDSVLLEAYTLKAAEKQTGKRMSQIYLTIFCFFSIQHSSPPNLSISPRNIYSSECHFTYFNHKCSGG